MNLQRTFHTATLATTMTLALPADKARADWDVNVGVDGASPCSTSMRWRSDP